MKKLARVGIVHRCAVFRGALSEIIQETSDLAVDFSVNGTRWLPDSADATVVVVAPPPPSHSLALLEFLVAIRRICPALSGVVLFSETRLGAKLIEALQAGVMGLVDPNSGLDELITAIRCVHMGGCCLCSTCAGLVSDALVNKAVTPVHPSALPKRQREVLIGAALGSTSKAIAYELCLSRKTVESHKRKLMERLGATTDADLHRYAIRFGLIHQPEINGGLQ